MSNFLQRLETGWVRRHVGQPRVLPTDADLEPGPVATRFHKKVGAADARYLQWQTVPSPRTVARVAFSGFMGRRRFITPGLLATFNFFAMRIVPRFILAPLMAWFFGRRE